MKKINDVKKLNNIWKYENKMREECKNVVNTYTDTFKKYNCELQLDFFWYDFLTDKVSYSRNTIGNGYSFWASISVKRDGRVVRYEDIEGEMDYYEMVLSWSIVSVTREWFKLKIFYTANVIEEMKKDLLDLETILKNMKQGEQEIGKPPRYMLIEEEKK